jgi:hypothetical protein
MSNRDSRQFMRDLIADHPGADVVLLLGSKMKAQYEQFYS